METRVRPILLKAWPVAAAATLLAPAASGQDWSDAYAEAVANAEAELGRFGFSEPGAIAGDILFPGDTHELTVRMDGPGIIVVGCDDNCDQAGIDRAERPTGQTGQVVWVDVQQGFTQYPADVRVRVRLFSCSTRKCAVLALGASH